LFIEISGSVMSIEDRVLVTQGDGRAELSVCADEYVAMGCVRILVVYG
jgi:hypothetical protein